ncbi:MAG: hypothetical protein OHK0046_45510 [Anaerolineae bacterium]
MNRLLFVALAVLMLFAVMPLAAQDVDITPDPEEVAEDIVDITVETAEATAEEVEDLIDRITQVPQSDAARVLLVLGGILLLTAGWRVYDFIVVIAGLLIGAAIGASLVTNDSDLIILAAMLIGGLLGAALSVLLYYAAVFVIGGYVGILLFSSAANAFELSPISPLALLVAALVGGVVLLALSFEFLVLLSSLVGAQMLSLGLGLDIFWTLIFAVAGIVIQFGLMRAFKYDFRRRSRRFVRFPRIIPQR